MRKIEILVPHKKETFMIFSADLYLNWLVPYFRNHRFVKNLVFNRDSKQHSILIEFECNVSSEFLRFANDLNQRIHLTAFISNLCFSL